MSEPEAFTPALLDEFIQRAKAGSQIKPIMIDGRAYYSVWPARKRKARPQPQPDGNTR